MSEPTVCPVCGGSRWVCEDYIDKPWGDESTREDACHCGGAGVPCPSCNLGEPKMPDGVKVIFDQDGWRN